MVGANFLDQLIFRHSLGVMVDIVTLGTEELDGLLGDILENEETKALVVDGVEDLGNPRPHARPAPGGHDHHGRDGHEAMVKAAKA